MALAKRIQEGEEIILDVTFALRHLPFVYLAALAYLVGLRGVKVKGIYYGAQMLEENGIVPLLDISLLFDLMEWYHALAVTNETGDFRPVASLLRNIPSMRFIENRRDPSLSRAASAAEKLAAALASGLPLEVGSLAHNLCQAVKALDNQKSSTTASTLALGKLEQVVQPWAVPVQKADLELSRAELERQLMLAEWYLERMNIPTALLVLREWLVNAVLLSRGVTTDWLDYGKHRKPVESFLNALIKRNEYNLVGTTEREFVSVWSAVAKNRNEFAHAGMKQGKIPLDKAKVRTLLKRCWDIFHNQAIPSRIDGSGELFLITPLGLSPGVLYSALHHVQPDRVLIITSSEASHFVPDALTRAGRSDLKPDVVKFIDPHHGFNEARHILDDHTEWHRDLILATDVVVNITGGTTAMQYAAEHLGRHLKRYGTAVRRVALVDRRDILDQRQNPYVVGELVELDD